MNTQGNLALKQPAARKNMEFGEYESIETIGEGGMGVVYRAHDPTLGRDVAIKVLRDGLRAQKNLRARFRREGQAVASLNHPNIVQIYSVGTVNGIPYIAMEYVDGESLADIMKRGERMDWQQVLAIAEQVAEAGYARYRECGSASAIGRDLLR
ncbi:MAG: protein kinase, partial [Candidatus Hydrogenedentes bacterium]|nr:protein kinase [Candidatus Hydrogenedentota bacterium]